jgi:hypothetical protein
MFDMEFAIFLVSNFRPRAIDTRSSGKNVGFFLTVVPLKINERAGELMRNR